MIAASNLVSPAIIGCSVVSVLLSLAGLEERRRLPRFLGWLLLAAGAIALMIALADPRLIPLESAIVHPDGSSNDPRVLATLLLGVAALAVLLPTWRAVFRSPMGATRRVLPGVVVGGLFAVVASFVGLHQPMALAGVALAAFGLTSALLIALRGGPSSARAGAVQSLGTQLLVLAGLLSLHGARATGITLAQGAARDTLGHHVRFTGADTSALHRRVVSFVVAGGRDSSLVRAEMRGPLRTNLVPVAGGAWLSGPVVLPISLAESHPRVHGIQWVDRSTPLHAGDATIRLLGFRFVHADTIRLHADLEVTSGGRSTKVSPGVYATSMGEMPFAAIAPGFGPIAVARVDADHGRVGLVLPQLSESAATLQATIDFRLRPALPVAWAGAALGLLAFLFGMLSGAARLSAR